MFILPAEADEALVGIATDRIAAVVAKHDGQVRTERWGRRRLAYEIDDRNEGYYVVVTFSAEPVAQLELERVLNLADEVLRHKVVVLPTKREKQLATSPASAGGDATPQGE
ncbi:MAG: 30S ribosomal protein S6 [Actinobacteria bacterium]|nr:30S ribosomal protein S6 [Actinomycetota bacterium]